MRLGAFEMENNMLEPPWALLRGLILPIALGNVEPLEGLKQLYEGIRSTTFDFETPAIKFIGDAYGIEDLLSLYYGYEGALEQPYEFRSCNEYAKFNFAKLKEETIEASLAWVQQYARYNLTCENDANQSFDTDTQACRST